MTRPSAADPGQVAAARGRRRPWSASCRSAARRPWRRRPCSDSAARRCAAAARRRGSSSAAVQRKHRDQRRQVRRPCDGTSGHGRPPRLLGKQDRGQPPAALPGDVGPWPAASNTVSSCLRAASSFQSRSRAMMVSSWSAAASQLAVAPPAPWPVRTAPAWSSGSAARRCLGLGRVSTGAAAARARAARTLSQVGVLGVGRRHGGHLRPRARCRRRPDSSAPGRRWPSDCPARPAAPGR